MFKKKKNIKHKMAQLNYCNSGSLKIPNLFEKTFSLSLCRRTCVPTSDRESTISAMKKGVNNIFSNQSGISGLQETRRVSALHVINQVHVYFSCLGKCSNAVYLWSSKTLCELVLSEISLIHIILSLKQWLKKHQQRFKTTFDKEKHKTKVNENVLKFNHS